MPSTIRAIEIEHIHPLFFENRRPESRFPRGIPAGSPIIYRYGLADSGVLNLLIVSVKLGGFFIIQI